MSASEQHNLSRERNRDGGACPEFEKLSAYFDGALDREELSVIETHVSECAACQAVLHDVSVLRSALQATTPAAGARVFQLSGAEAGMQSKPLDRVPRNIRPFPLYPALAAVAALLVVALIAGDLLFKTDGSDFTTPDSADEVLVIDGTPYPPDNAVFSSASSDDMNSQESDGEPVDSAGARDSDSGFLTGWRVAQLLALAGLVAALSLWWIKRGSAPAKIRD